jgi:hypothetical protein
MSGVEGKDSLHEMFIETLKAERGWMPKQDQIKGHSICDHPVEIADVQSTMKRRTALLVAAIGLVSFMLGSVVAIALYAGGIRADVTHLQEQRTEDRDAIRAETKTRETEDRAIRKITADNERENARQRGELVRSTTRIETHLKVIAENGKRRR